MVDIDSSVCEVFGYQKQGAAYEYTRVAGYHPMLAFRADTGEVLHCRQRKDQRARPVVRIGFVVKRSGVSVGPARRVRIVLRADSGYWSAKVIKARVDHDVRYSITVKQTAR